MNADNQWTLDQFNDSVDACDLRREWEEWFRSFELVLELKKMESQHEKLVFMLARGGRGLQRIYYNLRPGPTEIYPEPVKIPLIPQEVPEYDNAVKRLNSFFVGKRNERIELEVFRSLKQTTEEPFNQFILKLRTQATRCEFQDREEREILQQVTIGARDERVRDKGLENIMNLDEIINYAVNREILAKQKEKLHPFATERSTAAYVNHLEGNKKTSEPYERKTVTKDTGRGVECDRCGSWNHRKDSRDCFARNARCNRCGRIGHFARKCRASGQAKRSVRPNNRSWKRQSETNSVQEEYNNRKEQNYYGSHEERGKVEER